MKPTLTQLVERGDREAIHLLLDSTLPSVSVLNQALWKAVRTGRQELIGLLVEHGADADSRDDQTGWSLLHSAVEHRQPESIRELVKLGADIDAHDSAGATPLHLACDLEADAVEQTGREIELGVVELLLELGADPCAKDKEGRTARDWASEAGLERLTNLLR